MEHSGSPYANELRIQMLELEDDIATLKLIQDYVSKNIIKHFFTQTFFMLAEIVFYAVFVLGVIAFGALQYFANILSEVLIIWVADYQELEAGDAGLIIVLSGIVVLLCSVFNLFIGVFVFRKLRQNNNKLEDVSTLFNKLLEHSEDRFKRIKTLGVQ